MRGLHANSTAGLLKMRELLNQPIIRRSKNFSAFLFFVLLMNIFPSTVVLGMSVALSYVLLNYRLVIYSRKTDFIILRNISWPIFVMLPIGLCIGVLNDNNSYDVYKDAYFFVKVLIYFLFGYIFFKKNHIDTITNTFIWLGLFVSVSYLALLFVYFAFDWVDLSTVTRYKRSTPDLSYDPLLSILLLLLLPHRRKNILQRFMPFIVFIQIIAITTTISRLSLLILLIIGVIKFRLELKVSRGVFLTGSLMVVLFVVSSYIVLIGKNDSLQTDNIGNQFKYKIENIFNEMFFSDFRDKEDIVKNWRAYEALQGVYKYRSGTASNHVFGHGFGELTDIGIEMKLGGVVRTDIPIFHNGYIYLLVKLGATGVALYLLFLYEVFSAVLHGRKKIGFTKMAKNRHGEELMIFFLIGFLICITAVFFGIFNNAIFNNISILLIVLLMNYRSTESFRDLYRVVTVGGVSVLRE